MADGAWDEKQIITAVRYDPIPAGEERKVTGIHGEILSADPKYLKKGSSGYALRMPLFTRLPIECRAELCTARGSGSAPGDVRRKKIRDL